MPEKTDKRISVTATTFDTIREFCRGLNMEYSDCLMYLYQQVAKEGESPIEAGLRIRKQQSSSD